MPAIQPVLGHKPITSYFSLVPNATKRKCNPEIANSASETGTKRRKQTVIPSDVQSSTSRGKEENRGTHRHLKGVERSSPNIASTRDVDWPYIPLPNIPRTTSIGIIPLTPPTTIVAPSRYRITSDNEQKPQGPGPSTVPEKVTTPFLVTPSTPARRYSMPSRFNGAIKRLNKPCTNLAFDQRNGLEFRHEGEHKAKNVDVTIPSSQSQDIGIPELVIDLPLLLGAKNFQSTCRTLGEEDSVVNSSQSQLLTLVSPGKRRNELRYQATQVTLDFIPSSQSQERELSIPSICRNDAGHQQVDIANRAIPQMGVNTHRLQERTLSDELFAVPMQPSILDNIFSDEGAKASEDALNVSETDTESESPGGHDVGSPLGSMTHDLSISQPSFPAADSYLEGSYSSLPPAVQDFREMFGNDDESYPVDFPESLRL